MTAGAASAARVYDYFTGGTDWHDADRDMAARMADPACGGYAGLKDLMRDNRRFVAGAVQWLAGMHGISQYLDLGCGLPVAPAVHEIARGVIAGASCAYVDIDPLVVSHARRLEGDGVAVLAGDLADVDAVLEGVERSAVIDFARPAAVILGASLTYVDADTARAVADGYARVLAKGSAVVISCATFEDADLAARLKALFAGRTWRSHTGPDVASFFAGLRMVRPAGDVRRWLRAAGSDERPARISGGIGYRG